MIKTIITYLIYGITGGCVLFVMYIIFMDLTNAGGLHEFLENFTIYALSFIVISTGFSMSSIVYEIKRMALWLKIVINILVGFGIFFLVGSSVGIISLQSPIWTMFNVAIAAIIFIAVYVGGYLLSKHEAKIINAKVQERKSKRPLL